MFLIFLLLIFTILKIFSEIEIKYKSFMESKMKLFQFKLLLFLVF